MNPHGTYIASGSLDKTIKIWHASTGALERTLTGHTNNVISVAWSPDSVYIASGGYDHTIKIWNASTGAGSVGHTLDGHSDSVFSVAYSPDSTYIASGSADNTIKIWNASTGAVVRTLERQWNKITSEGMPRPLRGRTNSVYSISWNPDGTHIAIGGTVATIQVWKVK